MVQLSVKQEKTLDDLVPVGTQREPWLRLRAA